MKGEKMDTSDTDSMTTVNVNVKEFDNPMDYQEPPPAYRNPKSTTVQVTKIVAVAAVIIAGMLSISIVFSAWISAAASCQGDRSSQQGPVLEGLLQPEHLKGFLAQSQQAAPSSKSDLDSAESKLDKKGGFKKETSSSEEDDSAESADRDGITMLRLPLELSLQEHMFEKNHRSHMNCVIEKKKAEEIVDEQSKPLPAILGINISTDPRYLHFTGEKMAISCDSGNDHRQMPNGRAPPRHFSPRRNMLHQQQPPQPHPHPQQQNHQLPLHLSEMINSALAAAGSASVPVHIIGPIPFNQQEQQAPQSHHDFQFQRQPLNSQQQQQQPFFIPFNLAQGPNPFSREDEEAQESNNFSPLSALGIPPHLINVIHQEEGNSVSGPGPIFMLPQNAEIRERALPHPVPIMPRAHLQHVIRPRRSIPQDEPQEEQKAATRVKRCSCDCACKNHQH